MLNILGVFCICGSILILLFRIIRLEKELLEVNYKYHEKFSQYDEKVKQIYYYLKDHKHD